MNYTNGPWIVTGGDRIKYIESRVGGGLLQEIASCMVVEHGNHEANARRIVACVNACEGIPTSELETAARDGKFLHAYDTIRMHRDELLEIVKDMRNVKAEVLSMSPEGRKYLAKMNAAIEKASQP
jgi:hypothetical protein